MTALLAAAGSLWVAPAAVSPVPANIPDQNVRGQVALLRRVIQPDDVILVGAGASYAFALEWPEQPSFQPAMTLRTITFRITYPGDGQLVVVKARSGPAVEHALDRLPKGTRRVWVVLSHDRTTPWPPRWPSGGAPCPTIPAPGSARPTRPRPAARPASASTWSSRSQPLTRPAAADPFETRGSRAQPGSQPHLPRSASQPSPATASSRKCATINGITLPLRW